MSEVLRLSFSVARSGWQAAWNRGFRFSRVKAGLIWLLIQIAAVLLVARRVPATTPEGAGSGVVGLAVLIAVQMGWFGLMYGFARGQMQLYQGLLVPLFQISPARPIAFLLGRMIEALPQRTWVTLLWAWAYSGAIHGPGRWPALLLLFGVGLAAGMLALLSGLLLLTFWGRVSPKSMRHGNLLFGLVTLALITWAIIYLSGDGSVQDLSLVMQRYRLPVLGSLLAAAGLPGAALLIALLLRPHAVEDLYRLGLYQVLELGERDVDRPGRSHWLPIGGSGVMRAVLSREWLQLARSRMARVQLALFGAGVVGVIFAGRSAAGEPAGHVAQIVGALSLQVWFLSFGHWVVRAFEQERVTLALYRLAAVPTARLVAAKLTSVAAPSALLVSAAAAVGSLAARLDLAGLAQVSLFALLSLAGAIMAGFGMAAATANQEPDEPQAGPAPRSEMAPANVPQSNAWWSLARTLALVLGAVLPLWAGAGRPGLAELIPSPVAWTLAVGLPAVMLVGGVAWMLRTWRA